LYSVAAFCTPNPHVNTLWIAQEKSALPLKMVSVRLGDELSSAVFAVVIVVIPVAIAMPTVPVFIPPPPPHLPTVLPRFVQFMAPMSGLLAPVSVILNGFVELVIRTRDSTLAIVIGPYARCAAQHKETS